MGAKTWMLVSSDGDPAAILASSPALDRAVTARLASAMFPQDKLSPLDDGSLLDTCPPDDELVIGCFPNLAIVAAREFGIDYPSRLPAHFVSTVPGRTVHLHAMHSVVDWFAYATWKDGTLARSLSLSPDSGILEDVGERRPFEAPYWAGAHPVGEPGEDDIDYPFPFHPLELGEAALGALFGYQLEGMPTDVEPGDVALMRFRRSRSWWSRLRGAA